MARWTLSLEQRFWSKVSKTETCWLWTDHVSDKGYGMFSVNGRTQRAHRVAWQLAHGVIPDGRCVCHHCDVRACVNPSHLWLGTNAENVADRNHKGRQSGAPRGSAHPQAKLTQSDVLAIHSDRRIMRLIADDYGVGLSTIHRIRRGLSWSHLTGAA